MMDSSLRAELIRKGNQAFNSGDYRQARELFTKAAYKDGLIRIGDHYMYERRLPLLAYGYYKRAGAKKQVEDLHRRMLGALGEWIGRDKIKPESLQEMDTPVVSFEPDNDGMIPVPVAPQLREAALQILNRGNGHR